MVVRRAMIQIEPEIAKYDARILGNIHDEIILSYPAGAEREVLDTACDIMQAPIPELPATQLGMASGLILNIDIEVGTNWANLRTWER